MRRQIKSKGANNRSGRAGKRVARRPTRGIEIKEDTYAMIKVIDAAGQAIPLVDSSSPEGLTSSGYTNFILQSVTDRRMEKQQIVETFGDSYIFFFGEAPRIVDIQAILINSHDFNWRAEWWENYNNLLRGTRLVENGARVYLFYDDIILEGYMLDATIAENAQQPYETMVNFKLFVTNYSNISLIGNPHFPIRSSVVLPEGVDLTDGEAGANLIAKYRDEQWDLRSAQAFDNAVSSSQKAAEGGGASFTKQFGPFVVSGNASADEATKSAQAGLVVGTKGGEQTSSQNPLARKVSDAFRAVPRSFAVSQDVWAFLYTNPATEVLGDLVIRAGNPIRGKFVENFDEYVGQWWNKAHSSTNAWIADVPSAVAGTVRGIQEVDDLWREAIQFLSCYGADINNSDSLISLGLGPNGLKLGFGGESVSFNPFSDEGRQRASDFFDRQVEQIGGQFEAFAQDPLGNVFGRPKGSTNDRGLHNRPKYTEGAGDPYYGYPSDFADGQPGFGVSGFGDFGGLGFGSGQGSGGDPGFKDPSKFTFAGVANEQGAFDRFTEPKKDTTSLGIGAGVGISLGTSGISGGAGVSVNGKPSAFAVVSVPGLLDPTGSARQAAEAIAEKQAQQRFGFANDNPFGVKCPKPEGSFSYSDSFTLP